jgi:hypothetical protein
MQLLSSENKRDGTDCHLVEEPVFKVRGAGLGMQLLTAHDHSNNKRDALPSFDLSKTYQLSSLKT